MALTGMALLQSRVAIGALHNSGERFDAPKCHEGTRTTILDDIMKWLDNTEDPQTILWVNGSAGAGKSAIAQAIATLCYEENRLSGAFFMSRTAPVESGRSDEKRLVATLVFQMMINVPYLQHLVLTALEKNPFIFDLDMKAQIEQLIIKPLSILSDETDLKLAPFLILLDGLDECINQPAQARIVEQFSIAISRMQHKIPHKILIASRTEPIIRSAFMKSTVASLTRSISLNDDYYQPDEDIRRFLTESLVEFRRVHPSPSLFPENWPRPSDIEEIVKRASRQFVYASTVRKYIEAQGANPIERLRVIIGLQKDPRSSPYEELDSLYSHLFRQAKNLDFVLDVLCMIHSCFGLRTQIVTQLETFFGMPKGGVRLAFQDLSSVIRVDETSIRILHASLTDFVVTECRSGPFFIFTDAIHARLFQLCIDNIWRGNLVIVYDGGESMIGSFVAHFFRRTSEGGENELQDIASRYRIDAILQNLDRDHAKLSVNYARLFGWIFDEQKRMVLLSDSIFYLRQYLPLRVWVLLRLQKFEYGLSPSRMTIQYLENVFLCKDPEMHLFRVWINHPAMEQTLKDKGIFGRNAFTTHNLAQLLYQWCFYIVERHPTFSKEDVRIISSWGVFLVPYHPQPVNISTYNYLKNALDIDPANFITSGEILLQPAARELQYFFPSTWQMELIEPIVRFMRSFKKTYPLQ